MKSVGRFTPPPKSPSPTYPQIVCMIYPQIVFGDLPPQNRQVRLTLKSSVRFTLKSSLAIYPPKIAKSDLPSNHLYDLPSNRLWRFTPPHSHTKSPSLTYPQIIFSDLLPFECEVFEYIVLNIKNL